eukprot:15053024-Ditylum_brightwellii.AAC.1
MATQLSNQQNTDIATIVKNIRHQEEVKHSFQLLRPISKGTQGGAVSSVLVSEELKSPAVYNNVVSNLCFASKWMLIEDDDD